MMIEHTHTISTIICIGICQNLADSRKTMELSGNHHFSFRSLEKRLTDRKDGHIIFYEIDLLQKMSGNIQVVL